jgi:hypothetical protein
VQHVLSRLFGTIDLYPLCKCIADSSELKARSGVSVCNWTRRAVVSASVAEGSGGEDCMLILLYNFQRVELIFNKSLSCQAAGT